MVYNPTLPLLIVIPPPIQLPCRPSNRSQLIDHPLPHSTPHLGPAPFPAHFNVHHNSTPPSFGPTPFPAYCHAPRPNATPL